MECYVYVYGQERKQVEVKKEREVVQICTTTLEINLAVSQKTENSSTSRPSYTSPGHIPKDAPTSHKDDIHSSFIHNSQKLETT